MRAGLLALIWIFSVSAWAQTQTSAEFFEKKIRPVFANKCQGCHNLKLKTAGLDLSSADGFARGGQSGAVVVAGKPEDSRIVKALAYTEALKMPPTGKLSDGEELADFSAWVRAGAVWPGAASGDAFPPAPRPPSREFTAAEKKILGISASHGSGAACRER